MRKERKIEILAARTMQAVLDGQCEIVESADTLKEARGRARHLLTEEFQHLGEMSEPLRYVQITVDGSVHSDFFARGYNGEDP